jgi:DNA modification methylase
MITQQDSGAIPNTKVLNKYYASNDILIYNNDCLDVIEKLEDNSIDLVITSPPYNVNLGNNKYNKNPYDLYGNHKWNSRVLH